MVFWDRIVILIRIKVKVTTPLLQRRLILRKWIDNLTWQVKSVQIFDPPEPFSFDLAHLANIASLMPNKESEHLGRNCRMDRRYYRRSGARRVRSRSLPGLFEVWIGALHVNKQTKAGINTHSAWHEQGQTSRLAKEQGKREHLLLPDRMWTIRTAQSGLVPGRINLVYYSRSEH